ncbi:MAG: PP2C family protein-serine/threonine phosphatase [Butyrivibrio sp.]|nr:PP2C family protein-serine/threonine phosphatase [Butyrivibrio sp.]
MEEQQKTGFRNKKISRKKQLILVQTGLVITLLFSLLVVAVGNMITMSAFSTALSGNLSMFEIYMQTVADEFGYYDCISAMMDYWHDNADYLVTEDKTLVNNADTDAILKSLSKKKIEDITDEEFCALSPENQKTIALACYKEIQETINERRHEEKSIFVLVTMKGEDEEDPVAIISNDAEDGILLGEATDIKKIKKVINNTKNATQATVWKWAFTTPGDAMMFGASVPFSEYKGESTVEMLGVFMADIVYEDMIYTKQIRQGVIVMMVIIFAEILLFLYFIVSRPLIKVQKCLSTYAVAKDTNALRKRIADIHSNNEIGAFAEEFAFLAEEMERYNKKMESLAAEKERVETELNVASNIQMHMLPLVFPENQKISIYGMMDPAKEVGGDFYDCYMIDDDHLAMTIADVSGKGVPAALFMAVSKTMLKNRTQIGGKPSEILKDVNNWLCEGNDSCMFVTVWHGILTISTGELVCANAGHEYPMIRYNNELFKAVRSEHGMMLGIMENVTFVDECYMLNKGDALFQYTDGIPEAINSNEEMFGEERLEAVLQTLSGDEMPREIMRKVRNSVNEFVGTSSQFDDLTMLCLVMK